MYRRGRMMPPRRVRLCSPDQVANAKDSTVNLTPASQVPAQLVRANWDALLPGKAVPLINETHVA
jgi:hypothetical protein